MNRNLKLFLTCALALMSRPETLLAQDVSPEMAKLIEARDDKRCQKLGALPSTDAYVTCRLKLQEMAQEQWAAQNLEMQELNLAAQEQEQNARAAASQYLLNFSHDLLTPPPRPVAPPIPVTTHCTSEIIYGRVQTVCRQ